SLANVNMALGVNRQPLRPVEISRGIARLAKLRYKLSLRRKHLDAEIQAVIDEHVPVRPDGDRGGMIQLAHPIPFFAELILHFAVAAVGVDSGASAVHHIHQSVAGMECHRSGLLECAFFSSYIAQEFAIGPKLQNPARTRIRHINMFAIVYRYADRTGKSLAP